MSRITKSSLSRYKELLVPLKDKLIAFIFDECHHPQFGENPGKQINEGERWAFIDNFIPDERGERIADTLNN